MLKRCFKGLFVLAVIATGAGLILGPRRALRCGEEGIRHIEASFLELKDEIAERERKGDPVGALREQVEALTQDYPRRIRVLEGERVSVANELETLERELVLCERVLGLCDEDERALQDGAASTAAKAKKLEEINRVRTAYSARKATADDRKVWLLEEARLIEEALVTLRSDLDGLEAEKNRLDRELAALERSERIVEILGERQPSGPKGGVATEIEDLRKEQHRILTEIESERVNRQYEARAALQSLVEQLATP